MSKKILYLIKIITPVALFNIIFFAVRGADNPASVWISYAMIHVAYGFFALSPLFNKDSRQNRFFEYTNTFISFVYCAVQFIAGLVFIILSQDSIKISLFVQLPLLGIYIILVICNVLLNKKTEENTAERESDIRFLNQCKTKLSLIISKKWDAAVSEQLTRAKELLESSPAKSYSELKDTENEMLGILDEMEGISSDDTASAADTAERFIDALNKRNITLKTLY